MPRPPDTLTLTWRDLTLRVEHIRDWKINGWSRLIIKVAHPRGAPLPFAEDGYHTHELDEDTLKQAGGVTSFVLTWLEREAASHRYAQALYRWKQKDLFR